MDPLSIGFVVLVILLGGVIAWAADRLGRTFGKKRLTLFGLRPRHTATLFTVLSGILIPLLTVVAILAASAELREIFLKGRQLREDLKLMAAEVESVDQKLRDAREELQKKEAELAAAQGNVEKASAQVTSLRNSAQSLQGQVKAADARVRSITAERKKVESQLGARRKELSAARERIGSLNGQLQGLRGSYDILQKEIEDEYRRADALNKQITALEQREEELTVKLSEASVDLETKQRELQETETELAQAETDLAQIRRENQELERAQLQLREAVNALETIALSMRDFQRLQPMIYSLGSEIARYPVDASLSQQEAETAFGSFMSIVDARARMAGAEPLADWQSAAGFVPRRDGTREITIEEQERQVIDQLTDLDQPSVVVGHAAWNAFQKEFVPISIRILPNPLVYHAGEVIAEDLVNGTQPDEQIFQQLSELISQKVRAEAEKDQMIPIAGAASPLGEVPAGDMLELVRRIRNFGRQVRVSVLARNDTRAADQLQLDFRIR